MSGYGRKSRSSNGQALSPVVDQEIPHERNTTIYGATDASSPAGSPFVMNADGSDFQVIGPVPFYNFEGGLVRDAKGNLCGAAGSGGTSGGGGIYRIDRHNVISLAYSFTGAIGDHKTPVCTLAIDAKGVLYGTTSDQDTGGGPRYPPGSGRGTVFSYNTNTGVLTTLHIFNETDGWSPLGGVVRDAAGNLYGATEYGGTGGKGVVYEVTP